MKFKNKLKKFFKWLFGKKELNRAGRRELEKRERRPWYYGIPWYALWRGRRVSRKKLIKKYRKD